MPWRGLSEGNVYTIKKISSLLVLDAEETSQVARKALKRGVRALEEESLPSSDKNIWSIVT